MKIEYTNKPMTVSLKSIPFGSCFMAKRSSKGKEQEDALYMKVLYQGRGINSEGYCFVVNLETGCIRTMRDTTEVIPMGAKIVC